MRGGRCWGATRKTAGPEANLIKKGGKEKRGPMTMKGEKGTYISKLDTHGRS